MPRPNKNAIEFRSSDREIAKKMLREYFQQKGGLEYMKNAQQPSMFQDTETGEYIARPQRFNNGGMYANKQYRRGERLADMLAKYMNGGMINYENGGKVDPNSPEFKEYLEYRSRGGGGPLYFEEYQGEALSPSELRQMIREQGSGIAIPRSLMPESLSERYMNEAMLGYSSGPAAARATMADAMSEAEARYNQNRKFEQEFLEYMRGKSGAAPRREPGMLLEQTPAGQLTEAEKAARRALGL